VAIADGRVGPEQFTEKYQDPQIRELIEKISVQADPELDTIRPAGISEIISKRGELYSCRVDYPRGHARNPMTDGYIIEKFKVLAGYYLGVGQINRIVHTVFELDKIEPIGRLNRLMVF
jgi:2-methylcitrate dehydratase